jgi:3'-5' exoribonuclease
MKLMKKDIKQNQQVTTFFALESMQIRKSNKAKQNFLLLNLYDKSGKITGYLWNDPLEAAATLQEKSFVKVKGLTTTVNGSLILNIERIRTAERHEVDLRDFLEVVSGGVDLWHNRLLEQIELINDQNCKRLTREFLNDEGFMELFMTSPGGVSVHHNYIGGLLEHTVGIMSQAALYADRHPALLDKDLLLTGAFLHDIGKTREIYWEIAKEYTAEGKLLGHIAIGLSLLEEKLRNLKGFPADLALLLKHMVLSHHGTLEWGSPVRPSPPEALVLHLLDNLDAKVNHLYCHLGVSDPEAEWSPYDKILNTEIYQKKFERQSIKSLEGVAT